MNIHLALNHRALLALSDEQLKGLLVTDGSRNLSANEMREVLGKLIFMGYEFLPVGPGSYNKLFSSKKGYLKEIPEEKPEFRFCADCDDYKPLTDFYTDACRKPSNKCRHHHRQYVRLGDSLWNKQINL